MSNVFPDNPRDGTLVEVPVENGGVLIYQYHADDNVWKVYKDESAPLPTIITTRDVTTTAEIPVLPAEFQGIKIPDSITVLRDQKLVNWAFANEFVTLREESGSRAPIFSDTIPMTHPDYPEPPGNQLIDGDVWFDTTNEEGLVVFVYYNGDWQNYAVSPQAFLAVSYTHLTLPTILLV